MNNLITKILAIKELSERGERGEAQAAKTKLILFLKKYNLTLADILHERRKKRVFRWRSTDEAQLLTHVLLRVTGSDKSIVGNKFSTAMLNEIQYFDVKQMYEWHIKHWRMERKDFKNAFKSAYYEKHNLAVHHDTTDCECIQVNIQMAREIFENLSDETYCKKLTA